MLNCCQDNLWCAFCHRRDNGRFEPVQIIVVTLFSSSYKLQSFIEWVLRKLETKASIWNNRERKSYVLT
jgi:hypothetical protein